MFFPPYVKTDICLNYVTRSSKIILSTLIDVFYVRGNCICNFNCIYNHGALNVCTSLIDNSNCDFL